MSRIGRLPVAIPAGVTVEVAENNVVTVKGPKGTLTKELPCKKPRADRRKQLKTEQPEAAAPKI